MLAHSCGGRSPEMVHWHDARPGFSSPRHDTEDRPIVVSFKHDFEGRMLIRGLLVGAAAGAYMGLSGYMAGQMSRVPRTRPETTPDYLGLDYEDAVFTNRGGSLELRGWRVWQGSPDYWVILVHGSGGNRAHNAVNMLGLTRDLVRRGVGVLTFDLRAHGESQGSRVSIGHEERTDLQGAIDYLEARGIARDRIGVLGFSLGAVISILAAAEERGLAGLVLDSPFASLMEMVYRETSRRSGVSRLFLPGHDVHEPRPVRRGPVLRAATGSREEDRLPVALHPRCAGRDGGPIKLGQALRGGGSG